MTAERTPTASPSLAAKARSLVQVGDLRGALAVYEQLQRSLPARAWDTTVRHLRAEIERAGAGERSRLASALSQSLGIDAIYVVNLARRPDRLARVLREMTGFGLSVTRIDAVDALTSPEAKALHRAFGRRPTQPRRPSSAHVPDELMRRYRKTLSPGVFGYLLSQARVLAEARRCGHRRILVLDDDVFFSSDAATRLPGIAAKLPSDWRIVHLGASEYADRTGSTFLAAQVPGAEGLYHPIAGETCGSFAVAYDQSVFDDLLQAIDEADGTFDNVVLGGLYLSHRPHCFVIDPAVCIPDVGDSDIRSNAREQQTHSERMGWEYLRYESFAAPITVSVIVTDFAALRHIESLRAGMPGRCHLRVYYPSQDGLRPVVPGRVFAPLDKAPQGVDAADGDALRTLAHRWRLPASDAVLLWPGARALEDEAVLHFLARMLGHANRDGQRQGRIEEVVYCLDAGLHPTPGLHSVVVPCFRPAEQVWPTIESALAQDVGAYEVVIVNDNPDDAAFRPELTRRLNAHAASRNGQYVPRVQILEHGSNRNASAARNTGFLASSGEFLSFLDDDDHFEPDRLRTVVSALAAAPPEVGACYCGYTGTWNGKPDEGRFPTGDLGPHVLTLRYAEHYMCTNTVTFRRTAFARLGGFNEAYRRHQDLELMTRFFNEFEITAVRSFSVRNRPNPVSETFVANIEGLCRLKHQFLRDFRRDIVARGAAFAEEVIAAHARDITKRDRSMPQSTVEVIHTFLRSALQV